jgi:hypothetical protein
MLTFWFPVFYSVSSYFITKILNRHAVSVGNLNSRDHSPEFSFTLSSRLTLHIGFIQKYLWLNEDFCLLGGSAISLVVVYRCFRGTCCLHHYHPDDGGSKYVSNVSELLPYYMALQPRRQPSSFLPP